MKTRLAVFAVEDTAAQVCWSGLAEGTLLQAGGATATVPVDERPGAAVLEGLPPATTLHLTLRRPGGRPRRVARFRTLAPPPGEQLCRFATVNDLHIGERHFGVLRRIKEEPRPGRQPYATRCAGSALSEAVAWGAQLIVAKGDLTYHGRPQQWEEVARMLGSLPVPVEAMLGNHDVGRKAVDGRATLAAHGITLVEEARSRDLPGLRIVLADTAVPRKSGGRVGDRQRRRLADLLAAAPGPAFLAMHHYPQRFQFPTAYPRGIPGDEARALLETVIRSNPATLVTAGHSHRNRRHSHGPLVVSEIGATMHYPGAWAGYAVHEGGIRQVVRRVAAPEAMEWTDRTRRALLGLWAPWAAGSRRQRCFSVTWPERA
ncbi:MAG: metallophosphoesterase [Actinomycetota bacterium]|nr:metallophosphoesterase [Actinomycetota bacterium]